MWLRLWTSHVRLHAVFIISAQQATLLCEARGSLEMDLPCQVYTYSLKIQVSIFTKETLEAESGPPEHHPHSPDIWSEFFLQSMDLWRSLHTFVCIHSRTCNIWNTHTYVHMSVFKTSNIPLDKKGGIGKIPMWNMYKFWHFFLTFTLFNVSSLWILAIIFFPLF